MMSAKEIYHEIITKIRRGYQSPYNLITGNDLSHTKIFLEEIWNYKSPMGDQLGPEELPLLECTLENGNYFLMTTYQMISHYRDTKYTMPYSSYWWFDTIVAQKFTPITSGKTITYKYYSLQGIPFWYEIDSIQPADIAHNCILYHMRKVYSLSPPSIELLPNSGFSDQS